MSTPISDGPGVRTPTVLRWSTMVEDCINKSLASHPSSVSKIYSLTNSTLNLLRNNYSHPNIHDRQLKVQRYLDMCFLANIGQWPCLSPFPRRQIPFIRSSTWSTNVGTRWSNKKKNVAFEINVGPEKGTSTNEMFVFN